MSEEIYDNIVNAEISEKMKNSYIEYAMSVIISRALPDVRDGLKPVHRRILYAMDKLGLDPSKGYRKCSNIVGKTMGDYHPHGDSAIYDALVRMAQDFSMRYPLVAKHGNFGSIDGYPAAASRYTEAKLSKMSMDMLKDIEKNTVDFVDNYDGREKEPVVLPSRFPNLLVNGSSGIAVGMATNIPPHNLTEVIDALIKMIDDRIENNQTNIEDILNIIKGPDFPIGATILGKAGIRQAYTTGKGRIRVRAKTEIIQEKNGREKIIVTQIPYQVYKSRIIEKIAELVKEKRVEGISDILDESDRNGIKIVIDCKKDANASVVLNNLYKYSQLQESYSINLLSIVDGEPKTLSLMGILEHYLAHQEDVVTKRVQFDYDKAFKRAHIVEGLLKALDFIDEIINIIRSNKDIKDSKKILIEKFDFTLEQVDAICEMRLRSLSGLERDKLDYEYNNLKQFLEECLSILNNKDKLLATIKDEFLKTRQRYGDERRTEIVADEGDLYIEDFIEDEMSVITMTNLNYIKRIPLATYKSQNRGGKGIKGMQTREEDFVRDLFLSSNHNYIYFFTNKGKVYRIKTFEIPEASRIAKGTPIINLIQLEDDEKITTVMPIKQKSIKDINNIDNNTDNTDDGEEKENDIIDECLVMTTKKGIIKKTKISRFKNIRKAGLIAVVLKEDDELISVNKVPENKNIFIATKKGMSIVFNENILRELSRKASGVRAINLRGDDIVVASEILEDDKKVLIVSENGYGKCTQSDAYKSQNRGGVGLKTYKISDKTGDIIDVKMIDDKEELIMVSSEGIIIRIRVKDISTVGRVAQGVKLINLDNDIKVVSVAKISEEHIEDEEDIDKEHIEDINDINIQE